MTDADRAALEAKARNLELYAADRRKVAAMNIRLAEQSESEAAAARAQLAEKKPESRGAGLIRANGEFSIVVGGACYSNVFRTSNDRDNLLAALRSLFDVELAAERARAVAPYLEVVKMAEAEISDTARQRFAALQLLCNLHQGSMDSFPIFKDKRVGDGVEVTITIGDIRTATGAYDVLRDLKSRLAAAAKAAQSTDADKWLEEHDREVWGRCLESCANLFVPGTVSYGSDISAIIRANTFKPEADK